jgi:DNA mismatch repair protein MutS
MLEAPLRDIKQINERQERVALFASEQTGDQTGDQAWRGRVRQILRAAPDGERALSRLLFQRGSPRDMLMIRASLRAAQDLQQIMREKEQALNADMHGLMHALQVDEQLYLELTRALVEPAPAHKRDGGFIADGYSAELDVQRGLRDDSKRIIAAM